MVARGTGIAEGDHRHPGQSQPLEMLGKWDSPSESRVIFERYDMIIPDYQAGQYVLRVFEDGGLLLENRHGFVRVAQPDEVYH